MNTIIGILLFLWHKQADRTKGVFCTVCLFMPQLMENIKPQFSFSSKDFPALLPAI